MQFSLFRFGMLCMTCAVAGFIDAHADFIDLPADGSEWRFTGRSGDLIDPYKGIGQMEERGMGVHAGVFGRTSGAGDPNTPGNIDGESIGYMYFDGYASREEGYRIAPGTTDAEHQEFTMIFDLFIPASNKSAHLSFFNGNDNNINDADYLITPSNRGVEGSSTENLWAKSKWQRMALVTDHTRGSAKLYVDGVEVSDISSRDFVWGGGNDLHFWILSDANGNHSEGYIANFAFVPLALPPADLRALGSTDPGGIFEVGVAGCPRLLSYQTDTEEQSVVLSWMPAGKSFDATGIQILREGQLIADLPLEASSYRDSLADGPLTAEYEYTVKTYGGSQGEECEPMQITVHYSATGLAGELVAYYRFEGDADDLAGSATEHNGIIMGQPTFFPGGKVGRGLRVNDLADPHEYIVIPAHSDLDFDQDRDFSVALWARHVGAFDDDQAIGGSASDPAMISNKDWSSGGNRGWFIGGQPDGSWKWNISDGTNRADFNISSLDESGDGYWHHVLVTHDRDGNASFYFDGKVVGSTNMSDIGDVGSGFPVGIGSDGKGAFRFDGDLDEVAIWGRVLTPDEVNDVYSRGYTGRTITGRNSLDSDRDGLPDGWEVSFFGNLDQAGGDDKDRDGRSNFLEYSHGTSPLRAEHGAHLRLGTVEIAGELHATVTYQRPIDSKDIAYLPEFSENLRAWSGGDSSFQMVGNPVDVGGGIAEWTVRYSQPISSTEEGFFRLRTSNSYQGEFSSELNPALSYRGGVAIISWETPTPAATIIEYALGDGETVRVEDFNLTQSHTISVAGAGAADDFSFTVIYLADGIEYRSENITDETFYDFGPVAFPDQDGFVTGGGYAKLAADILAQTGVTKGYCLDFRCGDGRLAYELARQSELIVIGVESEENLAHEARVFLSGRGVYGSRVTVVEPDSLTDLPFNPRTFNLIVSAATFDGRNPITDTASLSNLEDYLAPGRGKTAFNTNAGLTTVTRANLADAGAWTHQYGNGANTSYSGVKLGVGNDSTDDLDIQWIGRPGGAFTIDRQVRAPAPLASNGRLFCQGHDRLVALESHNGAVLWSMKIPGFSRLNVMRDAGNMCADENAVFLAVGAECWRLDGDSGGRRSYPVLGNADHTWGYVGRAGRVLIGSAVRQNNAYKSFWGAKYWFDGQSGFGTDQVCSDSLFALDATTGATLWSYSGSLVLDVTITTGDGKIWFLESRNTSEISKKSRRLKMADLKNSMFLTCLDIDTGAKEFERALTFDGGTPSVYLSYDAGKLVLATSRESNDRYYTCVLDARDGSRIWTKHHPWRSSHHGGNHQHPVVMGGKIYLEPNVYDLHSGTILASNMPGRSGCSTFIGTGEALVYRGVATIQYGGNVSMWPIGGGSPSFWDRTRPSCWISAIAADGMVIVQDGSSGCSCGSWLETSIGFAPKK
jgi:hypothetical protein